MRHVVGAVVVNGEKKQAKDDGNGEKVGQDCNKTGNRQSANVVW